MQKPVVSTKLSSHLLRPAKNRTNRCALEIQRFVELFRATPKRRMGPSNPKVRNRASKASKDFFKSVGHHPSPGGSRSDSYA